ncbi:MAG: aspartate--tRNA ligase [Planctomycetes bacterium]|nr:aspartate--tRNA ligase [Planctomycetota bacterium]
MKLQRTHTCGQLQHQDVGKSVILNGWVCHCRDHGDLLFIDLRDRYGVTQVVFHRAQDAGLHTAAKTLRPEFVVAVQGQVNLRPEGTANPALPTGEIEVLAQTLEILNPAAPLPMEVDEHAEVSGETRLRYRHLDLRRPGMQQNLLFRHRVIQTIRRYFDQLQFVDVETPFLTKSTPEGARDFLVPSRLSPGEFFALPQSPQLFKQVLMCAGLDRYYQIVRCFRDEDLRADRQPEFTQLDVEMSFIGEEDIIRIIEGLMVTVMREAAGISIHAPFPRIAYREAVDRYGHDAPDLRFGLELVDVTDLARQSEFKVFQAASASGGVVRGLNARAASEQIPRRQIDALVQFAQEIGAKGLAWMRIEGQTVHSPIAKFFSPDLLVQFQKRMEAGPGDVLFFVAGDLKTASLALRHLRLRLGNDLGLIPKNTYHFSWVVDFPLLEWDDEEKRYAALHHPFTSPKPEHLAILEEKPLQVLARAYDLVLNGVEIGGGSIRIHDQEVQKRLFRLLGITDEDAEIKFGFLLECFRHGAPPHGGIALGLDRILMLLRGLDSIRDVIAFPKTQKGTCLFTRAPSPVAPRQLKELGIQPARAEKPGSISHEK